VAKRRRKVMAEASLMLDKTSIFYSRPVRPCTGQPVFDSSVFDSSLRLCESESQARKRPVVGYFK
jgi:hypothetical protein